MEAALKLSAREPRGKETCRRQRLVENDMMDAPATVLAGAEIEGLRVWDGMIASLLG